MSICIKPFTSIEIDPYGDVYTCCPAFLRHNTVRNLNSIGNILNDSFEEIWYSPKAIELRQCMLNGDYSKCDLNLCRQRTLEEPENFDSRLKPELPTEITLAYDRECNLSCITCRDEIYRNSKEKKDLLNSRIKTTILPLLKNAKKIALSGSGEVFASEHSRLLVKEITNNYPDVKFFIMSNGLLCNEANCDALGLTNKIEGVFFSLPALDNEIYSKIMVGGNLEIVLKNIEWLAECYKKRIIDPVGLGSVISDINFREIPKLVDFAQKKNLSLVFSQYNPWGTKLDKDYKNLAVWDTNHKNHAEFVKILKESTDYWRCHLQPLFEDLKNS